MDRMELDLREFRIIVARDSSGQIEIYVVTGNSDGSTTTPVWKEAKEADE